MGFMERGLRPTLCIIALSLAACGDSVGPDASVGIAVYSGDNQFGSPGAPLGEPLEARLSAASGGAAVSGRLVQWRLLAGSGAVLEPATVNSDADGRAFTNVVLGQDTGVYVFEASTANMQGQPARFVARAVLAPNLLSIEPLSVSAGDTVTINGEGFSAEASDNRVFFGGVRGTVVAGATTWLQAVVPACLPTRDVDATVRLGPVVSNPVTLAVSGDDAVSVSLQVGEALALSSAQALACVRLGPDTDRSFLLVPLNVATSAVNQLSLQLLGLAGAAPPQPLGAITAAAVPAALGHATDQMEFEGRIRELERRIGPDDAIRPAPGRFRLLGTASLPEVGHERSFNVLNKDMQLVTVTAMVQYVSQKAIIYQDVNAPANGFSAADFESFGRLFDDPIYQTVIDVYGAVSDVDGNSRVKILFTPVVNAMTERGSVGYVAGFFYGLDLTTQPGSNRAEIFYSVVPDPNGQFSDPRSKQQVLRVVPPVLAHELQHMVHFNQRVILNRLPPETHWLSEALAHMAEDVVGDVLLARGETQLAADFKNGNHLRAWRYLGASKQNSVLSVNPPGTLEERGAQWLLLKYLMGHHGELDLLGRLTQSRRSGVDNVTAETERAWAELFGSLAVALWADADSNLVGRLAPFLTFPNLAVRQELGRFQGGFPLDGAQRVGYDDFVLRDALAGSTPSYLVIDAPASGSGRPVHLVLTGPDGIEFGVSDRPRLMLLRLR